MGEINEADNIVSRLHSHYEPDGITVKELKELLTHWPDEDDNGKSLLVCIQTDKGSVHLAVSLSKRDRQERLTDLVISNDVYLGRAK